MKRRSYDKQPPPAWQTRLLLLLAFLFGATILSFAAWAVILFLGSDMS